ncbi:MAG: hypothetical protein HRT56_04195 [Coraliomargarita sp.]|nr:hypothetical protein [Coraliomargarita sp.]
MLLRPTPLSEKIDPIHMDEALARLRDVARAEVLTSASNQMQTALGARSMQFFAKNP